MRSVQSRRVVHTKSKNPRISTLDVDIKTNYDLGMSLKDLALRFDRTEEGIRYSLKKQGSFKADSKEQHVNTNQLPVRVENPWMKDRSLKHDVFDGTDESSMYWTGFLMADGCVSDAGYQNKQPRMICTLQLGDIGHLVKLKAWTKTDCAIAQGQHFSFEKWHDNCKIQWTSGAHADRLRERGLLPHKQGRFIASSVSKDRHFWRGMVDGDGSVYDPAEGTLYLAGNRAVVDAWCEFCGDVCGEPVTLVYEQPGVFRGCVRFKWAAKKIIARLYGEATVFLDRKMQTANRWLSP